MEAPARAVRARAVRGDLVAKARDPAVREGRGRDLAVRAKGRDLVGKVKVRVPVSDLVTNPLLSNRN